MLWWLVLAVVVGMAVAGCYCAGYEEGEDRGFQMAQQLRPETRSSEDRLLDIDRLVLEAIQQRVGGAPPAELVIPPPEDAVL